MKKVVLKEDDMATSSITENFVVEGEEQVEIFANAIEESYQESLTRKEEPIEFHEITTSKAMRDLINRWNKAHGYVD